VFLEENDLEMALFLVARVGEAIALLVLHCSEKVCCLICLT
jgi:hypothetical protein